MSTERNLKAGFVMPDHIVLRAAFEASQVKRLQNTIYFAELMGAPLSQKLIDKAWASLGRSRG